MKKKAVFIDRDGTINIDVGYPNSYDDIKIYPYSFEAVKKIKDAGFLTVIITNQSGVGRGLIKLENLEDIHARMNQEFLKHGVPFDGIYFCPHHAQSDDPKYGLECDCRKPLPGMGQQAASELDIDASRSYMIGDKVADILFGQNINAKPILVLTGYGEEALSELEARGIQPAYVAQTFLDAAAWIAAQEEGSKSL